MLSAFLILLSSLLLPVGGAAVVTCVTAFPCIQTVEGIIAVAGVLLVPDGLLLLVSLLLLAFLKLSDYSISDLDLNLSDYQISDFGFRKNYRLHNSGIHKPSRQAYSYVYSIKES
jgi:hypothetical protein